MSTASLRVFLAIAAVIFGCGCRDSDRRDSDRSGAAAGAVSVTRATAKARPDAVIVPSTYAGETYCADCAGIRTTLTLRPDGLFFLRNVHRGTPARRERAVTSIGSWKHSANPGGLVLENELGLVRYLEILPESRLRHLGTEDRPNLASLPKQLEREPEVDGFAEPFTMMGMVAYVGQAGRFKECATGRTWPIADEGDSAALERAYAARLAIAGEPLLATVHARLVQRPKSRNNGGEEVIVVEQYGGIRGGADCRTAP